MARAPLANSQFVHLAFYPSETREVAVADVGNPHCRRLPWSFMLKEIPYPHEGGGLTALIPVIMGAGCCINGWSSYSA
jgi:hypothetical protein